jgi:hypothetical protein
MTKYSKAGDKRNTRDKMKQMMLSKIKIERKERRHKLLSM